MLVPFGPAVGVGCSDVLGAHAGMTGHEVASLVPDAGVVAGLGHVGEFGAQGVAFAHVRGLSTLIARCDAYSRDLDRAPTPSGFVQQPGEPVPFGVGVQ